MDHKSWTTIDKASWGPGPWQGEVDKEQWADEATGYACLLKRGHSGGLCGYVGVPAGHPWHGKDYYELDAEVHGGLTYAGLCQEGPEEATICHVPAPGEPEPLYWLGFDCGHAWDVSPALDAELFGVLGRGLHRMPDCTYKPVGYVKNECAGLAAQAEAAAWAAAVQEA